MKAGEFRKTEIKTQGARQDIIDRAKQEHRQEAEDLQLHLRVAKPGEFQDRAAN